MENKNFAMINGELYIKLEDGTYKKSEYKVPPDYKGSIATPIIQPVNFIDPVIGGIAEGIIRVHENILGRNDRTVLSSTACGRVTNCFTRDGQWMGASGDRTGPCGTKKDHRRSYLCQDCWNLGIRI